MNIPKIVGNENSKDSTDSKVKTEATDKCNHLLPDVAGLCGCRSDHENAPEFITLHLPF